MRRKISAMRGESGDEKARMLGGRRKEEKGIERRMGVRKNGEVEG